MIATTPFNKDVSQDEFLFILQIIHPSSEGPELPTRQNEEFRPFIRRLPEFKFWYSATKATVIAFCCTFFELFNVPVFWPILVMYFLTLFCITMKRQIKVRCSEDCEFVCRIVFRHSWIFPSRTMSMKGWTFHLTDCCHSLC